VGRLPDSCEGVELFSLLLDAGDLANAVKERGDDALGLEGMA